MLPGSISAAASRALVLFSVGLVFYAWQVEQAAAPGRGIIMNVYRDPSDIESIWFESQ